MESNLKESAYYKAKKKVDALKKFYSSLIFYILFIGILAAVNYYTNHFSYMWFLWAAFGWGIGLFFHAIKVFRNDSLLGTAWEERKLKQFMEEEDRKFQNNF